MEYLYLADLKDMTEEEVKQHIANEYAGTMGEGYSGGDISKEDTEKLLKELENFNILIAYESVGSWGCDSSSYFLMKNKSDEKYYEFSGSHCSCYEFEGQYDPQEADPDYLKSDKFYFYTGGYDDESELNDKAVKDFIANHI